MVLSPTFASPYFCTVACPAPRASANWARVGASSPPAALARSRKNIPNRGPLVPPTPSQAMYIAVTHSR